MAEGYRVMDTQIFNLGLSVYASSAYIVVCSIVSDGLAATSDKISARWMGEPERLEAAIEERLAWQVIEPGVAPSGERLFAPNPASLWRVPGPPLGA